jgi:single-stranded DNA-binding protein
MPNFMGSVERITDPHNALDLAHDDVSLVLIVGHLGQDPEFKLAGGKDLAKFSLAVNFGKDQDRQTSWVYCIAWERTALSMESFGKGDAVLVLGKPTVRMYNDKEYAEINVWSVAKPIYEKNKAQNGSKAPQSTPPPKTYSKPAPKAQDEDNEIPF